MRVLVVVLNWNGITDTEKCLTSLYDQTYNNFEILVVDNGSTNNSLKRLRTIEETNKITVIDNGWNRGFAGGVNTGITYAIQKDFNAVALLNNDALADKNWLGELVNAIKPKGTGIATGLLLQRDGKTIDSSGEFYTTWGLAYPRNRDQKTENAPTEAGEVFGATGGASLFKTELFKEIGLFDKDFFLYYEDVDVSFRTQLAGWKVVYTPKAIAYHKQGASSKKIPGIGANKTFANVPQLFIKNVPYGLLWRIGIRLQLAYFLFFWNAVFKGNGWQAFHGVLRAVIMTPAALIKRYKIQKNKKVSAGYIKSIIWNDLPPTQSGIRKFRKLFTGKA